MGEATISLFLEGEIDLYEEIFNAWKREKDIDSIQSLSDGFFEKASEYLSNLRLMLSRDNRDSAMRSANEREIEYVQFMLSSLLRMRARKIALMSLEGSGETSSGLSESEVSLADNLRKNLAKYLEHVIDSTGEYEKFKAETSEKEDSVIFAAEDSNFMLLRILQPVPKLVGVDLEEYGPFQPEDIAVLPKENALALIARSVASEVKPSNPVRSG